MGNLSFLIILIIAFGALWLMSSRTRKQQRAASEFRNNLVAGDEVMTGSGLFGTVVDVEDDVITLETSPGGAQTRWIRAAIAKRVDPVVEDTTADDELEPADAEADRLTRADDEVIDVPDDLSSLSDVRKDDEPDTK
ncbi:preprotein translocase subunit YajC [Cellulomonas sp.]|uniref:preprotein translocase subunit YajC n=1 Tax=Cellulomonas sp. TaxID=40001 RepID=UPI001AFE4C19|nr:preprotein translocase subunit YajC [Cellulomonas sp.]MBO9555708.1 preprotein translocase subunit YajC [Cellulomonas sp.]